MSEGLSKEEQINKVFELADTNGDGKIDKREMIAFWDKIFES